MSDRPQRIAIVTPRFSEGITIGGAETLLKQFARRLSSAGLDVTVLTTCAQDHFSWANSIPAGRIPVENYVVEFFGVDETRDVGKFLEVQDRLCAGKELSGSEESFWIDNSVNSTAMYEHLAASEYQAIFAGPYLLGLTYHAALIHPRKTILVPCLHDEPFARLRLFRKLFESVGGLVFNTLPEYRLARRLFDLDERGCQIVGIGIDDADADPAAFSRRHRIRGPYALYSGRREPMKGTGLLLEYFNRYVEASRRDLTLVLTGSGDVDVPKELDGRVLDVGVLSAEEKCEAMAGAAVFIHPSVNESLSIVLLEALMAKTPVLVNEGSSVLRYHVHRSGGGRVFADYQSFADALTDILEEPDKAREFGERGSRYVRDHYDWGNVDQNLLAALNKLKRVEGIAS